MVQGCLQLGLLASLLHVGELLIRLGVLLTELHLELLDLDWVFLRAAVCSRHAPDTVDDLLAQRPDIVNHLELVQDAIHVPLV